MGLTDRRKTAKNLVDSRKNLKILTVSRKQGKKKKLFPRLATFKEGTKLTYDTYGCVFYFPATLTPYARQAKRLLGVDQDLGSISGPLRGTNFIPQRKCGFLVGINICDFQEVVPSKHQ